MKTGTSSGTSRYDVSLLTRVVSGEMTLFVTVEKWTLMPTAYENLMEVSSSKLNQFTFKNTFIRELQYAIALRATIFGL